MDAPRMQVYETQLQIPVPPEGRDLIAYLEAQTVSQLGDTLTPIRFVINKSDRETLDCEVGVLAGLPASRRAAVESIFAFTQRRMQNVASFNVVFLVPTGIGSTVGGHAGDATTAARMVATLCDTLIIHPNVVNASDVNEMPDNALYVEGSIVSRLLMGRIGLERVRANRVLAVMDYHPQESFRNLTINTVSAARASYGLCCPDVLLLDPPIELSAHYAPSGRAVGRVENFSHLLEALEERRSEYDAVAIASEVRVPFHYHMDYFQGRGEVINPWGGAEAILTHAVSSLLDVPTAHAPITHSQEVADLDFGIVDPRMAAEAISRTFFQCVLKGLRQSPRILSGPLANPPTGMLTASDVSCLVMPDKCLGLPTLSALAQGIPVIAVKENENILENDLSALPWARGQLYIVDNYWEAVGVLAALKAGLEPCSVRRPLPDTRLERVTNQRVHEREEG